MAEFKIDGITLANIKDIKKYATKADMEELVAYKRQNRDTDIKKEIDEKYADYPIFDFKFKKVDWELNGDNIEERREEIDIDGVIYVRAYTEDDDFETRVISNCDIADGLYDAIDEVNNFMDDGWASAEVCYSTVCKGYGTGRYKYELGSEFGYVLSDMFGCDSNWFDYSLDRPVICRAAGEDWEQIWITDEWGNYCEDIDVDIDALIGRHRGR